ncbi:nucleotidyltransferase family protein [Microbacterium fluvii]|uniref:Nucleotidyltransferase family protein n=1 Tax=Microbacterium fluvii TaxID=415215 RepID=A0ABW2HFN9_9MICO|nr:nucleotidyltransferase domain-containing protein [Microbacterium fluvii]MCU4673580.1 nucleotidyltransferase domain-containing protein [Microbacterium fluvii]
MPAETEYARALRAALSANHLALSSILARHGAANPRLFGSVARGDAGIDSDVDLFVDLDPSGGNPLLRVAGIGEELSRLLGVRVDVVAEELLRDPVSTTVRRDLVAL